MSRLLVVSDLHLDAVTMGVSRFDELSAVLDTVAAIAKKHECTSLVFNGDLCNPDTPRAYRCITRAGQWAAQLKRELGIESYWVNGNHDVVEDGHGSSTLSPLAAIEGVEVIAEPAEYEQDGAKLAFLPYSSRANAYDPERWAKSFEPDTRLVFGHLNMIDMIPGSETEEMPRGRDVIWPTVVLRDRCRLASLIGGHYHGGCFFDGVHVVGSPGLFTFSEEGHTPRVGVIDLATVGRDDSVRSVTWVPIPGMTRFKTIPFDPRMDPDLLDVKRCFVRVRLDMPLTEQEQVHAEDALLKAGALGVKFKLEMGEAAVPKARLRLDMTAADGDAIARELAKSWPTPDRQLSLSIERLVEQTITERA